MHARHLTCGVVGLTLAFVPAAMAQNGNNKPPKGSAITLAADPTAIVFSGAATLSGRVSGPSASGVTIRLEEDTTSPYGDSYKPSTATAKTDNGGKYSLAVRPLLNTWYRAVAQTSPSVTSAPKLVMVRMRVGIKLSDPTPARGTRVTFSGSVYPAHDGRSALIQKRSTTGRYVTIARTTLRDAGDVRSSYSRRVLVRDGVYRVKVTGDADHINGFSRARTINVAS
ncbi:MAG TPA: hypothetical protein VNA28_00055 [Solirubrobacteraceae bacterium]|nr:hypothetical protein [Solirubrobacteraceae bacterium]